MSESFLVSLRHEISALEADVSRDPRIVKLQRLRDVLALYDGGVVASGVVELRGEAFMTGHATRKSPVRPLSESRVLAEKFSAEHLVGRTRPTPTRELYEMLLSRGVEVGGKQPISNLSAILSKSNKFQPIGREGWVLVDDDAHAEVPKSDLENEMRGESHGEDTPLEEDDGI